MQNMKLIPRHQTNGLAFSTFSKEEVLKMSVLEVTNPNAVDILGHPTANGVHDPRFGSIEIKEACVTCGSFSSNCYGHFGHIVLPVPVFNPVLTTITFQLIKGSCLKCCHMMASQETTMLLLYQLMALNHGLTSVAMDMEEVVSQIVADNHSLTSDDVKLVKEKLEGMITDAVGGGESKLNESSKMDVMVKSVVDCRNIVIGNYFSAITVGKTCCPWCSCKRRTMYLESQARIILGVRAASVKKPLVKTTAKKKKRSKKKEDDDEELEEDLFPHQEEAENTMTNDNVEEFTPENQVYMSHIEAREHLLKVYKNEHLILDQIFGSLVDSKTDSSKVSPIEGLFLEVLPVSPTRFRPMCTLNGEKFVNPHSSVLNRLVQECIQLRHVMLMIQRNEVEYPEELKYLTTQVAGKTPIEKMHHLWFNLQVQVNSIYHGSTDKVSLVNIGGVKQLLEKKEGMFRMYMMGKRVNYAARSVISPDPYINVDEIGIPDIFAKKLTYPQPVTPWNIKQMRQAVINGPKVHPGAVLVQNEDGSTVALSENSNQREAIAKQLLTPCLDNTIKRCKIVYRHLQNGDILLVNRQPTLHKPSIMAHKACILVGEKTLRLNYSNCKSYNADFDGDEMNAHFPQGEVARAEAYGIVSVNHQYLVPKDGTPLGGLIQDHIISSVLLMIRGKFFGREDYQQLVFGALTNRRNCVQLLHPSILKPCVLWSGKQVVSTVIINTIPIGNHLLSLTGKSKIPSKSWLKSTPRNWLAGGTKLEGVSMTESEVVIRNGEVLCGILDKAHCGPTPFGLIHCCYELYGGEVSGLLLSHLGRLFTHFLQIEGFTLGVKDILVTSKADKKRTHYMRKARKIGVEVVCDALNVDKEDADPETLNEKMAAAHLSQDDVLMKQLDLSMKVRTDELNNKINKVCVPDGLLQRFPDNNLQLMILSGAKGATVNSMQISCMLGQIELEGCRPRPMGSGKTLPSFVPYDPSPRAGGFVDCRFLTGVRPQEYFFHCMAGREGLIDTAVKTSRSGYLQRCLIKHMEGVGVGYDLTVRDSDGSVIQFQYGEDSLDIVKIPFLCKEQFPFLLENLKSNQQNEKEEALAKGKHYQKTMKKTKKVRKFLQKEELEKESLSGTSLRTGSYLNFSKQNLAQLKTEFPGLNLKTRREYGVEKLMEMWYNMDEIEKSKYEPRLRRDPVTSRLRSDTTLGAISEKMDYIIESYLKEVPVRYEKKRDDIRTMLHQKVMRSVCEPGEAVGLLAAQSIGEPSTQMTLNTFHFAGRGEMNVTLGIPRLREILMTASANIATPTLEVPFLANISKLEKKAETLKQKLSKVFLSEVLEKISINESIIVKPGVRKRVYTIRFHLLPYKYYKHDLYVTPAKILYFVEHVFLLYFIRVAKKKLNIMQSSTLVSNAAMRETHGAHTGGGEEKDYLKEKDGADVEEGGEKDDGVNDEGLAANRNDESSEDEHDDDAVAVKNRNRHKQEQEYDDEQNDDMEYREDDDDDEEDTFLSDNSKLESEEDDPTDVSDSERPLSSQEWTTNISDTEITSRIAHVLSLSSFFTDYNFDTENEEWWEVTIQVGLTAKRLDMITLLVEEAKKSVVHETPGINRAFVVDRTDEKGNKQKLLKTDGINIQEIFNNDKLLDLNRLYCNDIHAMANTYGIEAAFRVIVKEVQNVFRVYGIEINPRHLLLVADYMTFDGAYHAFNRKNLEKNASPLQQMTFEATAQFLKQATFMGFKDPIKSPSARLIVGRLVNCGTGSFSMMQPIIT